MNKEFNCKFIEDLLLGYIEGTLNEETKKKVNKEFNCKFIEDLLLGYIEGTLNEETKKKLWKNIY